MELLFANASLHSTSTDQKRTSFEGWASVFHTLIDSWMPTRILPGAFTKTLKENAKRIKILFQHDPNELIGVPTELREEPYGLFIKGTLSNTPRGIECGQLLKDHVLTEMSIGFDPIRQKTVTERIDGVPTNVRHIEEVRLWEVSLVGTAANKNALVTAVHRRSGTEPSRRHNADYQARVIENVHSGLSLLRELQVLSLEQSIAAWGPRFTPAALQSRMTVPEHVSRRLNDLNYLEVRALERRIAAWRKES